MNEILKKDYQRICEMAFRAKNVEQAEVPLFYVYLICQQLGLDNTGIRIEDNSPSCGRSLSTLHEAIWTGVAKALRASPAHIRSFRPVEVYSFRSRLIKVELQGVEIGRPCQIDLDFDLEKICKDVVRLHCVPDMPRINRWNDFYDSLIR